MIAVVIPTVGRMFWVLQLVDALRNGTRRPDEVIVVDQTPESQRSPIAYEAMEGLAARDEAKYLFSAKAGASLARNLGAWHAGSEIVVFLDDDVFVPRDFLAQYERIFEDEEVDAATGMILVHAADDGTFKPLVRQPSVPNSNAMLRGGNFAIRREVFVRLGGMDERFVRACNHEDWDLAWRLYEGGFKAVWDPGPWCYHAATPQGGGRWEGFSTTSDRAFNIAYFFLQHPEALRNRLGLAGHMLRQFVLNRGNVRRPWLLPFAAWVAWQSVGRARAAAKAGPILPLKVHGDCAAGVKEGV